FDDICFLIRAEDGIRDFHVTGVQTCALPIYEVMTTTTPIPPDYTIGTWTLDPTHSEVSFTVKHLMISKVRGTFETFDVTIVTARSEERRGGKELRYHCP